MQHIPHHSLDEIERSRQEMADFMNEKPVWPNLTLTGQDVYRACKAINCMVDKFEYLTATEQKMFEDMAIELNRELDARQAWFEGEDKVTISSVRCSTCGVMLDSEHAEGHACWQKGDK